MESGTIPGGEINYPQISPLSLALFLFLSLSRSRFFAILFFG